jgi:Holin of 3TMs, for gene-transfer release
MGLVTWIAGKVVGGVAKQALSGIGGKVVEAMQLLSDAKTKKIEADVALAQLEMLVPQMQMQINLAEAQSSSLFVSGWRPFVGWTSGLGLFYAFLLMPLVNGLFVALHWGAAGPMPSLDITTLLTILLGMLGLSYNRMTEKINGVARD